MRSDQRRRSRYGRLRVAPAVAVAAITVSLAACGSTGPAAGAARGGGPGPGALSRPAQVTLILDYLPNAVHAGIYRAIAAGYYADENIDLHVIQPTSTSETLKLIDAGRAQFGLADGLDVTEEIAAGHDAKAILAITQLPLGAPIALASEHLSSPAQLQGRTVGITGVPSDTAVLDTVVRDAGGDPAKIHVITVGYNGPQDLLAGRIAAFLGYWPADGVQLAVAGHPVTSFKLDRYGGPAYPGLVAFTDRSLIASNPRLVRDFVTATVHGYEDTLKDPRRSLNDLLRLNPTVQRRLARASLDDYLPLFDDHGQVRFGTLRAAKLSALVSWMLHHRLISKPIPASRLGTDQFLPASR